MIYRGISSIKIFLRNFFTCIGTISPKNTVEILFRTFCCVFLLFRIRTPGAFAKLHNGNLQHFPRKCPRRENAKAMKLCVQAIYIYFPFLIPQRYVWVKKKALSGNVIKLSKSAHTKKKPTSTFRGGHFLCFRYVDCLCLLRGQDNDLSLVNGVAFTRRSALRSKMALYFIKLEVAVVKVMLILRYYSSELRHSFFSLCVSIQNIERAK